MKGLLSRVKNSIKKKFSREVPLERRICYIMLLCASFGHLFGTLESAFIELPAASIWLSVVSLFLLLALTIFGFHTKHTNLFAFLSIFFVADCLFPPMVFTNGGMTGGMPFYLIISAVCIALATKGKIKWFLFTFTLIENAVTVYLCYKFPNLVLPISEESAMIDNISSIVNVSLIVFFFASIVSSQNEHDRRIIEKLSLNYRKMSETDELTGLFNRRYFKEVLKISLSASEVGNIHLAIFDLDDFKKVNDTFGHGEGDLVLKQFASILREESTNGIRACRYGGEEFLLLIPKSEKKAALEVVENIRIRTRNEVLVNGKKVLTVSCGLSTYGADMDPITLIKDADTKLYYAKNTGKNKVVY